MFIPGPGLFIPGNRFGAAKDKSLNMKWSRLAAILIVSGSRFGAAGLSRRTCLMDKPLEFSSLFDLIKNYDEAYKECGQKLIKVNRYCSGTHSPNMICLFLDKTEVIILLL